MTRPPASIGRYRILSRLGEGHFGVVWLAEGRFVADAPMQKVAIKQLSGAWSLQRFETLVREFDLLAEVKHPSICRVFEFLDRDCAVVLEYVEGVTLRVLLDAFAAHGERVWPDVAARIGQELADALFRAHDLKGLVHRDVKPENVMLTPRGEIKLLDFGLAVEGEAARKAGGKGTPLYMAPEQARSESVTHQSDVFALGLLLFELLTGTPAYPIPEPADERSLRGLMERIEHGDVGGLSQLKRDFPELGPIVVRCLAPDPRDRFPEGRSLMLSLAHQARRASLGAFAAFAWEGPLRPDPTNGPTEGTLSRREDPEPAMSKNPDPIRPVAPPPGAPRPRPQAAARPAPAARPTQKMYVPGEAPAATSSPARPAPAESSADLAMVPLGTDDADLEPGTKSSATSFFSMPKPKKRAEEDSIQPLRRHDPLSSAGGASAGNSSGGGGFGIAGPVAAPPGPAQMPYPMTPMQAAPVPLGIQGPMAGGGLYGAPSPHSVQLPPDLHGEVERARSHRVFAVVLGLMMLVFSVMIVTVLILVGAFYYGSQERAGTPTPGPVAIAPPPPPPVDTGERIPDPPPVVPDNRTKKPPSPGPKPSPGAAPTPKPPPAPSSDPAQATISLAPGSPPFTSVEIRCAQSGFRDRGGFEGGVAKVPGVPREDCEVFFKGGPPAKSRISGGQSKTCSFQGVAANCQ